MPKDSHAFLGWKTQPVISDKSFFISLLIVLLYWGSGMLDTHLSGVDVDLAEVIILAWPDFFGLWAYQKRLFSLFFDLTRDPQKSTKLGPN